MESYSGLGNSESRKRRFLNVSEGKIVLKDGGNAAAFDYVEGTLERIYQKEREFHGEKAYYWYLDIRGEGGDLYSLGLPYASGVFKSIVLSLASAADINPLSTVRIATYFKDGRTKSVVYLQGRKLDWITRDLPPVVERAIGGRTVKDDSERMRYIECLVDTINGRIGAASA